MALSEPGEWAVLLHNSGGRLFRVGALRERLKGSGWYASEHEEHPGQMPFEVWAAGLVKVEDKARAEQLVAVLDYISQEHRLEAAKLITAAQKRYEKAADHYRIWPVDGEG